VLYLFPRDRLAPYSVQIFPPPLPPTSSAPPPPAHPILPLSAYGFGSPSSTAIPWKEFGSFSSVTTAHSHVCKAGVSWHSAQAWPDSFINPALTAARITFHDTKPSSVIHLMPRFTVPKTKEHTDRVSGLFAFTFIQRSVSGQAQETWQMVVNKPKNKLRARGKLKHSLFLCQKKTQSNLTFL
jgi:hypothetical protein